MLGIVPPSPEGGRIAHFARVGGKEQAVATRGGRHEGTEARRHGGGKIGVDDGWRNQNLSGSGGLAEGDVAGERDLSDHHEDAGRGKVRINVADETVSHLRTEQHRRGLCTSEPDRLSAFPAHRQRIIGRIGNTNDPRNRAELSEGLPFNNRTKHRNRPCPPGLNPKPGKTKTIEAQPTPLPLSLTAPSHLSSSSSPPCLRASVPPCLSSSSAIEVLSGTTGTGATTLALRVAKSTISSNATIHTNPSPSGDHTSNTPSPSRLADDVVPNNGVIGDRAGGKWIVVIDHRRHFYPPAAAAMGIPLERLLIIQPRNDKDAFWATDQAMRCPAVASVIALNCRLDTTRSRRLQLAAEKSGAVGIIITTQPTAGHSFASLRLKIDPVPFSADTFEPFDFDAARRCRISVLKIRNMQPVEPFVVGLNDETLDVPAHALSADRTTARRVSA